MKERTGGSKQTRTLREIKAEIGSTKGIKSVPAVAALRSGVDGTYLVAGRVLNDRLMEIYSNGFAVYQRGAHRTVLRMEYVGKVQYEEYTAEPCFPIFRSYDLLDEDWAVSVMLAGEKRLEENYEDRRSRTMLDVDTDEDMDDLICNLDAGVDIEEIFQQQEAVEDILSILADFQRKVVELHILECLTQEEVSERLGKSRSTVRQALRQAKERLKKNGYGC